MIYNNVNKEIKYRNTSSCITRCTRNVCRHYILSYIMKNKYCYYTSSRIT